MSLTLVLGGTRSGKSRRAEELAVATGAPVRYLATASDDDPSMASRIARHVARRPAAWDTVVVGSSLATGLQGAPPGTCILVDGVGAWLASVMQRGNAFDAVGDDALETVRAEVLADLSKLIRHAQTEGGSAIVVAEQAGEGLLPTDAGARAWLDLLGEAVQWLAERADPVEFMVAGRPTALARARPAELMTEDLRHHGDADLRPGAADHAVNVLSGGPPAWLRATLREALVACSATYPSEHEATRALADLHGRDPSEIVPTNGAVQALWLLPAALRPRLAACVHPGFTEGEAALRAHDVPVLRVLRDGASDFALNPSAVPEEADLVLVGNPASPSGTLDGAATLLALRRPGRVVVVDEAFMNLVPGEPGTLVSEPLSDMVVVRSITKALSLPGLRAGYAVAAPALADRLRAVRPPWSANGLALAALVASTQRPDALAELAQRADSERQDLARRLGTITGVRTWPSSTNFCLVEVANGPAVIGSLRAARIAVRPASSFPGLGPGHIRITARTPAENATLADALERAVIACG